MEAYVLVGPLRSGSGDRRTYAGNPWRRRSPSPNPGCAHEVGVAEKPHPERQAGESRLAQEAHSRTGTRSRPTRCGCLPLRASEHRRSPRAQIARLLRYLSAQGGDEGLVAGRAPHRGVRIEIASPFARWGRTSFQGPLSAKEVRVYNFSKRAGSLNRYRLL